MTWRTRGWPTDAHAEVHNWAQNFSWVQRACKKGDEDAAEARDGPSSRDKMWVWMMSGWTAAIVVAPP